MYRRKLCLAALCFTFVLSQATSGEAAILAHDQFNNDGPLVGMSPSPGPGNAWAAHSGAGNKPVQVAGGTVALEQSGGSGEDVNVSFAAQGNADTTYACFSFNLPSNSNSDIVNVDGSGLYFAHFSGFVARTGVVAPSGGGDFGLAINADSSNLGAGTSWASDLSFDTDYHVVISYNAATGESNLWLDPADISSTSISHTGRTGESIEWFGLRQSNDYDGAQIIDNVVVGQTFAEVLAAKIPEPTSIMLMVAGLMGVGCVRRK